MDNWWEVPKTEEGLQQLLKGIKKARKTGNDLELGYGSLALSHLVKWVRSDNDTPIFERSYELAHQAYEAFLRSGNKSGQVRALIAGTANFIDNKTKSDLLNQAEEIANETGDETLIADVLAARGRAHDLYSLDECSQFNRRALNVYRRTGNPVGNAKTLFSLALTSKSDAEKFECAIQAAQFCRLNGDPDRAAGMVSLGLRNAPKTVPSETRYELAIQGLRDGLDADQAVFVLIFIEHLADICISLNRLELARKFQGWTSRFEPPSEDELFEIKNFDPTPKERAAMVEIKAFLKANPE